MSPLATLRSFQILGAAACIALTGATGCAAEGDEPTTDEAFATGFTEPGTNLGKATQIFPDTDGKSVFVLFNGGLEQRSLTGKVTPLPKIARGVQDVAVSPAYLVYATRIYSGSTSKYEIHWLDRKNGFAEVHVEDISTPDGLYKAPIAFLDDVTIAAGVESKVLILDANGAKSELGGYMTKLRGDMVWELMPAGKPFVFFATTDHGETFEIDATTKEVRLVGALGRGVAYDAASKTFVVPDFHDIKLYGDDGKLLRKVDLVSEKGRYIAHTALVGDKVLVTHASEKSQERYMLASYDLKTLTRHEEGSFAGVIGALAPVDGKLYFTYSPQGAEGMPSARVWYAHVRNL